MISDSIIVTNPRFYSKNLSEFLAFLGKCEPVQSAQNLLTESGWSFLRVFKVFIRLKADFSHWQEFIFPLYPGVVLL